MIRVFIDTEFTDFDSMELISIALVTEDGKHEFYAENNDHNPNLRSQFVNQIVVPMLDRKQFGMSHEELADKLVDWIDALPAPHTEELMVVCDYSGDWNLLHRLLTMASKGPQRKVCGIYFNHAIKHELTARGDVPDNFYGALEFMISEMEDQWFKGDPRQHHALVDARAMRYAWEQVLLESTTWRECE